MSLKCFLFCGSGGDTEYLDDVETFDGRRWKRANYKLDQVKKKKSISGDFEMLFFIFNI